MTGKTAQATSEPEESRTRRSASRPDTASLVQGLDQLRDSLLRRLDVIESMAQEQASLLDQDSSERERELRERVAVLEAALARTQAESKRREQEWQGVLQQLEEDRRLLAEAWDRYEREQVEGPAQPLATPPSAPVAVQSQRPHVFDVASDSVTRAILQQFQALKNDVRRNAKGRNGR
jgi:DNA repair exonuclease SbcCD ATPase subunit